MSASDVIIAGSGPAGAMLARDLARAGASVRILERGGETPASAPNLWKLWRRKEALYVAPGVALLRGMRVGGGSTVFYHTAVSPPLEMFSRYGVEMAQDLAAVLAELPHQPLEARLLGPAVQHIASAARALGLPWRALPKMIYQELCGHGGCPPAAFWSATSLLAQAKQLGGKLETGIQVNRVLVQGGRAVGVEALQNGQLRRFMGGTVILSAGGVASPVILQRSGILEAGRGFFCDPLRIGVALNQEDGHRETELSMSAGFVDREAGYMLTDMTVPPNFYRAFAWAAGRVDMLAHYRHSMMIMVKIRDEISGEINADGHVWRHFSAADKNRMHNGVGLAADILRAAGGRRVFFSPWLAAHPGGSVRLGELLDERLSCRVPNLHVCDASVIPESWGLPPTLTVLSLAKYLGRILLG
ncbi:FAD-dependent oxidoreductase [Acidithiobacillus ferridurans]|uniref:FAD-dependent oxidoreductase n=1 Tax=Acidithiobacillus ferridurans TaxID=1232575 RepID=UPI001C076DB1|nr:FAD-dependent oxidoreductase [Acidithiobacillus ferridurans]MBU2733146.1 GMC family oxidoreductase [Acidithiobacillus ferridurans]